MNSSVRHRAPFRSSSRAVHAVLVLALAGAPIVFAACETKITTGSGGAPPARGPAAAPAASASAAPKMVEYTENDFAESDGNRDPFRSYLAPANHGPRPAPNQRKVELAEYGIDDLKLGAIVLGEEPRAMFVDPHGFGTVVYKNTYICRPDTVHMGGASGADYQVNWRVKQIREGEVWLIREDPAQPAVPAATRVISLHPEGDKDPAKGRG